MKPDDSPATENQGKIVINDNMIIQSLEKFFQIKIREIRQENVDNIIRSMTRGEQSYFLEERRGQQDPGDLHKQNL
jgi:hypothetical protein